MADPHSETGNGQPVRNKGESPLADGQAPGSAKKALKPTDVFAEKKAAPDPDGIDEADADELPERFWQTEKFRTRFSIAMICVLLGTFGVVCVQRYLNRGAQEETVTDAGEENDTEETSEDPSVKHTPEPLADLSNDLVEPTPIARNKESVPTLDDESTEAPVVEETPKIAENPSPDSTGIESEPFGSEHFEPKTAGQEQGSVGQKVAATPVSNGKIDDPFENDVPELPAQSRSAAPPPSVDPATSVDSGSLTKLEEIESNEPATLQGLEPVETSSTPPSSRQDSSPSLNSSPAADEFSTVEKTSPPVIQPRNPVSMSEPDENDLDQSMARFREVKIDSRQSSGSTKVVAADPNGPSLPSNSDETAFDDELPSSDEFETPTATRNEPQTIRKEEPVASPIFDEEPTPLVNTPAQRKERDLPLANLEGDQYVVRQRDTYWKISKQHYGTVRYFLALARYNRDQVPDPKLMRPGTKIKIPPVEVLEQQFPELLPKNKGAGSVQKENPGPQFFMEAGVPKYRVGPKDNLSVISGHYLGDESRWDEIYQLNQELLRDANRLPVGTILSLPPEASSNQMAREPREYR